MPPERHDVIVIGGGLGGLVSGALLAKAGRKVLLLEQHAVAGGCATTFRRKDLTIEVGLHELDGWEENDAKARLFDELEIKTAVEFVKIPEFYRLKHGKFEITVPDDFDAAQALFMETFPRERDGIAAFFRTIDHISAEIRRLPTSPLKSALLMPVFPLLYKNVVFRERQTVGDFLDSIINDKTLKLALVSNLGYYHDDPYSMSLLYFAVAQRGYFRGGYYIKGGSQNLSNHLAEFIRRHGGRVLCKRLVTGILASGGRVSGVRYRRTRREDEIEEAHAPVVIANCAVPRIAALLPEAEAAAFGRKTTGLEQSCSLFSLYLGFDKPLNELGNPAYSTFDIGPHVTSLRQMKEAYRGPITKRPLALCDYSQIDSGLAPPGKSVAVICGTDYYEDWDGLDERAYRARKEDVTGILLDRLEDLVPGATGHLIYHELATAKTIERYTLNPRGSVYGYAQTPAQAGRHRFPNRTPVPGLYLASAWAMPGGGFTGAMLSGHFCAQAVLRAGHAGRLTPPPK